MLPLTYCETHQKRSKVPLVPVSSTEARVREHVEDDLIILGEVHFWASEN